MNSAIFMTYDCLECFLLLAKFNMTPTNLFLTLNTKDKVISKKLAISQLLWLLVKAMNMMYLLFISCIRLKAAMLVFLILLKE